ncbi:unnamed protein product [Adineta steineri]|uniref:Uncharacterized protein n=1 Tax=Adineta steineri TaxID=433720 RepID=A0A814Z868_9BILA|nr:unnamed protein product [Adineta steineri]
MLWGNLYYVYMARKLAYKENRGDVCTMPYGINTPGAFAFIFSIILPTYSSCMKSRNDPHTCQNLAWHVALASNFMTGIILLVLCIFGEFIRRNTPSVALLSSISGIGFTYLALNDYLPVAASPIVSFIPFAIVMLGYFAGVKFGPVPVAFVALVVAAAAIIKRYPLVFPVQEMFAHIHEITPYLSTVIPTAISIAIGTIQCVESAKRARDFYPTRESMCVDGIRTLIGSFFGSILGMTTFIGHPAFKKWVLNKLIQSLMIFIGLVICSETLAITPQRHYPAFLLGIMPIIADWTSGTIISGVSSAYRQFVVPDADFNRNVTAHIKTFSYRGLLNFSSGSVLQCIFLTAIFMYMIDRKFIRAAIWSILAAKFSFRGLINAPRFRILKEKPDDDGWKFTVAYLMLAGFFGCFEFAQRRRWVKQPETEPDDVPAIAWTQLNRQRLL